MFGSGDLGCRAASLWWVLLRWASRCRCLFDMVFSLPLGVFIPRSETAESYENCTFIFLRNFRTVFYSDYQFRFCTNNVQGCSFSPHPCQHLFFINFKKIKLFILVFAGFSSLHRLFCSFKEWGLLLWQYAGFSLQWLFLLRSTGSRHSGFRSCGSQGLEHRLNSRAQA